MDRLPGYVEARQRRYIDHRGLPRLQKEDRVRLRKTKRRYTISNKRTPTLTIHPPEVFSAMVDVICDGYPADAPARILHAEILSKLGDHDLYEQDLIARFQEYLLTKYPPELQLPAVVILTRIASGPTNHRVLTIDLHVVSRMVNLLRSTGNDDIREEIVCTIGFIASECSSFRDRVLNYGPLQLILPLLNPPLPRPSIVRVIAWTLSCLVSGEPPVNFEQVKPVLPVLHQLLIDQADEEVLADTCWALSYLSGVSVSIIQDIIDAQVCPKLVELLEFQSDVVVLPALRTIGNIVIGDVDQTQVVIDMGVLPCLRQILTRDQNKMIHTEACWTIANILGGTRAQIQAVIDADIIPPMIQLLQLQHVEIKEEFARAILNASYDNGTTVSEHNVCLEHVRYMADQGCIKEICDLLSSSDPQVLAISLDALEIILEHGKYEEERGPFGSRNIYIDIVDECNGLDKIENLHLHPYWEISERSVIIDLRFWDY